jgi:basic amino acid/polyamine antiporter, APA family
VEEYEMSISTSTPKRTLGITGITVNAMVLIAPGAFLWLAFQVQSAQFIQGVNTGSDMVPGLILALIVAYLTALSYSELAHLFPEANTGSSYYFVESALLNRAKGDHYRFVRLSKFLVGWTSHLYYWVYPGLLVGTFSLLVQYIAGTFGILPTGIGGHLFAWGIAIGMAVVMGGLAYRGITGSTPSAIVMNVIQIFVLLIISFLAIVYRRNHPNLAYLHSSGADVVIPHNISHVIVQASIAIILLAGFETITTLGAETKNPRRDIPRALLISLGIQGVICYLFEYFSANFYLHSTNGQSGLDAAAGSLAPIGIMTTTLGDWIFGGFGYALMIMVALTILITLLVTTLSCLNTGIRVTYAMGKDREIPSIFSLLHPKYAIPHTGVILLTVCSAIVGAYCSGSFGPFTQIDTLTQVILVSNIGTFLLYGMTCIVALFAFRPTSAGFNVWRHTVAPGLGVLANVLLLGGIVGVAVIDKGAIHVNALVAMSIVCLFMAVGILFLIIRGRFSNGARKVGTL